MRPIIKVDESKLLSRMRLLQKLTGESVEKQIRRSARLLCVELSRQTYPFGTNSGAKASGENAILGDLAKLFFTVPEKNSRTRNYSDFNDAVAFHAEAKRNKARPARIAPNKKRTVTQRTFTKILKTLHKQVGIGKAGWAAAAEGVAADVGSALRGIPAWVKRHQGFGNSITRGNRINFAVTSTNSTNYADKIIRPGQVRLALNMQRGKFLRAINIELKAILKR